MGARKLKAWLQQPLRDRSQILQRQDRVANLMHDSVCDSIAQSLKDVHDLERILTRVLLGTVQPRELDKLRLSLGKFPEIASELAKAHQSGNTPALSEFIATLEQPFATGPLLESAIMENPPVVMREGGVIAQGYDCLLYTSDAADE